MSKHVLFALAIDPTARDAVKAGVPTSQSLASYTLARLVSVHVPSLLKSSLARCQANAVEFFIKVCFLLFDGSEVLASATMGKLCNVWRLENLRLA